MLVLAVATAEVEGVFCDGLVAPSVVSGGVGLRTIAFVECKQRAEVVGFKVICYYIVCIFNMNININQVIGAGHIVAAFANDIRGALLVICIRIVQCYIGFAL